MSSSWYNVKWAMDGDDVDKLNNLAGVLVKFKVVDLLWTQVRGNDCSTAACGCGCCNYIDSRFDWYMRVGQDWEEGER